MASQDQGVASNLASTEARCFLPWLDSLNELLQSSHASKPVKILPTLDEIDTVQWLPVFSKANRLRVQLNGSPRRRVIRCHLPHDCEHRSSTIERCPTDATQPKTPCSQFQVNFDRGETNLFLLLRPQERSQLLRSIVLGKLELGTV